MSNSEYTLLTSGNQTVYLFAPTNYTGVHIFSKVIPLEEGFHHVAIVADKDQPNRNYYLLIDGEVVYSEKLTFEQLTLNQSGNFIIGGNNDVDEIRFSNISRYELKYKQTK
jgi:hypothetical protein